MYARRKFAVRNVRFFTRLYHWLEWCLLALNPVLEKIGHKRLDKPFLLLEKATKGLLLDSKSCGQCIVGSTGLSCPMNCPKTLRNGPCGGVRANGNCEVEPDMPCVWVQAWEGNKRMRVAEYPIQFVQKPVDNRLHNTSAWLREVRIKVAARKQVADR